VYDFNPRFPPWQPILCLLSKVSFYTTVYEALSFHSQVIHITNLITPEAIENFCHYILERMKHLFSSLLE
jgi:hypothetical protein